MKTVYDLMPEIDHWPTRQWEGFPELHSEHDFWPLYAETRAYSLVHVSGFYNAYRSLRYIADNKLRGSIVECGCFLGGMTAFMALVQKKFGLNLPAYAFDTFTGFPEGSTDFFLGKPAAGPQYPNFKHSVETNIIASVGSMDGITLVEGPVEITIPKTDVGDIALLRLDTDHYDSTAVELKYYWPRLISRGVVIVDDYGCYDGSRRATDAYFSQLPIVPMLNRVDGGVYSGLKP